MHEPECKCYLSIGHAPLPWIGLACFSVLAGALPFAAAPFPLKPYTLLSTPSDQHTTNASRTADNTGL